MQKALEDILPEPPAPIPVTDFAAIKSKVSANLWENPEIFTTIESTK